MHRKAGKRDCSKSQCLTFLSSKGSIAAKLTRITCIYNKLTPSWKLLSRPWRCSSSLSLSPYDPSVMADRPIVKLALCRRLTTISLQWSSKNHNVLRLWRSFTWPTTESPQLRGYLYPLPKSSFFYLLIHNFMKNCSLWKIINNFK